MNFSQKLAIFLSFTSIPAIMSLKCYQAKLTGLTTYESTLKECPAEQQACTIVESASMFHSFELIHF